MFTLLTFCEKMPHYKGASIIFLTFSCFLIPVFYWFEKAQLLISTITKQPYNPYLHCFAGKEKMAQYFREKTPFIKRITLALNQSLYLW